MDNNILLFMILFAVVFGYFLLIRKNKKLENIIVKKEEDIQGLKKDIEGKFKKAQDVHRRMLPDGLNEPENFFISDYYKPAEYIGGDYYNLFKIDHESMAPLFNQHLFYFFDVSGHGIDSTLLSIFINDSIENYFKLRHNPGEMVSTKDLMTYIDQQYQNEQFPDDYLLCMFIGVIDLDKRQLEYSARGFQFPFYELDSQKNINKYSIGGLPISTAIGSMKKFNTEDKLDLKKNTSLFFSTDGLFESENGNNIYHKKIDKLLKKYSFLPAPYLNDIIQKDFYNFMEDKDNRDDITYLIMDYFDGDVEQGNIFKQNFELDFLNKIKENLGAFIRNNQKITDQNKLNFKFVDDSSKFMLAIEDKSRKVKWDNFLNEYEFQNETISMEEIRREDISKNYFKKEKIYISKNKLGNKIYFLLFKNKSEV